VCPRAVTEGMGEEPGEGDGGGNRRWTLMNADGEGAGGGESNREKREKR
jgi:hypothetical protein